jgi:long-chain acyl-CoA synthetase
VTTLPPSYSYGLSVINSHLQAGGCLVLNEHSVLSREFWATVQRHGATSLAGVPATYQMLLRSGFERMSLPSLRTLTQAGGALGDRATAARCRQVAKRGWRFFVMYGQTEATARISYVPPQRLAEKIGSIGVAIPRGGLSVDPANGELIYRGPNVMMGYASGPDDLALGDELGGVLRTGDLGRCDDDGFFHVTGRLKRFIKLAGLRVGLDEVERGLHGATGLPVSASGRDDKLVVWLECEGGAQEAQASAWVRESYGLHRSLFRVSCVPQLPLLPNGKKDYRPLLEAA